MYMPIPIQYAQPYSPTTQMQRLIILFARDHSQEWREFLASNPLMKTIWFNQIVDWLVEQYPEDFVLSPS